MKHNNGRKFLSTNHYVSGRVIDYTLGMAPYDSIIVDNVAGQFIKFVKSKAPKAYQIAFRIFKDTTHNISLLNPCENAIGKSVLLTNRYYVKK